MRESQDPFLGVAGNGMMPTLVVCGFEGKVRGELMQLVLVDKGFWSSSVVPMTVGQFRNACSSIPLTYEPLADIVGRALEAQQSELVQQKEAAEISSMAAYYLENANVPSRQQAFEAAVAWRAVIAIINEQGHDDRIAQAQFRSQQMRRLAQIWEENGLLTPLSDEQVNESLRAMLS